MRFFEDEWSVRIKRVPFWKKGYEERPAIHDNVQSARKIVGDYCLFPWADSKWDIKEWKHGENCIMFVKVRDSWEDEDHLADWACCSHTKLGSEGMFWAYTVLGVRSKSHLWTLCNIWTIWIKRWWLNWNGMKKIIWVQWHIVKNNVWFFV